MSKYIEVQDQIIALDQARKLLVADLSKEKIKERRKERSNNIMPLVKHFKKCNHINMKDVELSYYKLKPNTGDPVLDMLISKRAGLCIQLQTTIEDLILINDKILRGLDNKQIKTLIKNGNLNLRISVNNNEFPSYLTHIIEGG